MNAAQSRAARDAFVRQLTSRYELERARLSAALASSVEDVTSLRAALAEKERMMQELIAQNAILLASSVESVQLMAQNANLLATSREALEASRGQPAGVVHPVPPQEAGAPPADPQPLQAEAEPPTDQDEARTQSFRLAVAASFGQPAAEPGTWQAPGGAVAISLGHVFALFVAHADETLQGGPTARTRTVAHAPSHGSHVFLRVTRRG